jgi:large subunit ribosomal protein L13
VLGRLASHLAMMLQVRLCWRGRAWLFAAHALTRLRFLAFPTSQGKDKPTYDPSTNCGDVLVVVNAGEVALTGNKLKEKLYRRHTGYPGGLRTRTAAESLARDPTSLLRAAVERMLPRNTLRHHRCRKLRLFPGPDHPGFEAEALAPAEMPPRLMRNKTGLPLDFELPAGVLPLNEKVWAKDTRTRDAIRSLREARQTAIDAAIARGDVPADRV